MKKILVLIAFVGLGLSLKAQSARPDSIETEKVVAHIIQELHHQAHARDNGVIYRVGLLNPDLCYRELINKTTGKELYILVDCDAEHARTGRYFIHKDLLKYNK